MTVFENVYYSSHAVNDSINTIIKKYEATQLTVEEAKYFESLKSRLKRLETLE